MDFDTELPHPSSERMAVHLTNDALRHVRSGHPWIWDGSVTRISHEGAAGDLAVVFDDKRKFAGIGLWDPNSTIPIRMLHHGAPRPIDDEFFGDQILNSFARRQPLHDDPGTTGYRLVHGENDQLPGLVVDQYDTTLVVKLDSVAWVPHLRSVIPAIVELADAERVVVRASRRIDHELPDTLRDSPTVIGTPPDGPIAFHENGLVFEADVERGQKTGHFLDQRDNRRLVAAAATGAKVLDVFCNTGGFSVNAAAGGARSVHSIDISSHAIDATVHHMELNRLALEFSTTHTTLVDDAFEAMEDLIDEQQRFDIVIVDPPSFAPNSASVPAARRAYRRLTSLAIELLGKRGTLVQASCSSRIPANDFYQLVTNEIATAGMQATNTIRTNHALDHPVGFEQGAYLKAVVTNVAPARRQ